MRRKVLCGIANKKAPVELPADAKWIAAWERRLDATKTSIKEFCEFYRVPTKRVQLIGAKDALTDYVEYVSQAEVREAIESQWENGEGGKVVDGKPRQEGHSTAVRLLFWERFMRGGGGSWNIFNHNDQAVTEAFRLFSALKRQTPDWVFAHLLGGGGGVWKKGSARQLELVFPGSNASLLQCFTAGDKQSGSGSAPRGVFLDEFSKYSAEVKRDPTAMSEGWQDAPGNIFAVVATGQGMEEFAKFFLDARDGHGTSGFIATFRAWLGHPDRSVAFKTQADRDRFAALVGKDKDYGVKEELRLVAAGATLEELQWRRRKVSGLFQWDLQLADREYPLVAEDMFATTSRSVFYQEMEILKSHQLPARERERAARAGEFNVVGGDVVFEDRAAGSWLLLDEPEPDGVYCFGGDPSSGRAKNSDGKTDSDPSTCDIGDLYTGRQMARFRGYSEGSQFAQEMFNAAVYFNGARGFIERNNHGEYVIPVFHSLSHGPHAGDDLLMAREEDILNDGKRVMRVTGWFTSKKSKERMVGALREYLREVGPWTPEWAAAVDDGTRPGTPFEPIFLSEALKYERDDRGNPCAASGHDDTVTAKGLREVARRQLLASGDFPDRTKIAFKPVIDPLDEFYRARALAKKPGKSRLGSAY